MVVRYFNLRFGKKAEFNAGVFRTFVSRNGLETISVDRDFSLKPHDYDWGELKNERGCSFVMNLFVGNLPYFGESLTAVRLKLNPDGELDFYGLKPDDASIWEISKFRASEMRYAGRWSLERLDIIKNGK